MTGDQVDHAGDTPEEAAFRTEARAFLEPRLRPRRTGGPVQVMGAGSDDLEAGRAFLRTLSEGGAGWGAPTWPPEYGGMGATPAQAAVLAQELARFERPDLYPFMVGVGLVGPTLIAHGTPEQQARWLPAIRSGEEIWCQLFSEPGAGSDLAGLAARAARDGDEWTVSGQKVWSSRAHYSAWGLLLARTDPDVPKHAGITCFALDMGAPGVEVRPIRQINGDTHFNEVFLDSVRFADTDRIGPVGGGWAVAMTTLTHERASIGTTGSGLSRDQLLGLAAGRSLGAVQRDELVDAVVHLELGRLNGARSRAAARSGRAPGAEGSGSKIWMGDTVRAAADLAMALDGPAAVATTEGPGEWATLFLTGPSLSIRGGTDEILRNVMGERVLGLPPEPRADKGVAFKDVPRG